MIQSDAIKHMQSGRNVFLTGEPGAGKTYTLNEFISWAESKGKNIAITASTGIAASHIGGTTIHSWSGIGIATELTKAMLDKLARNKKFIDRYSETDILVIDEISMMSGNLLTMVDTIARRLRKKPRLAFGGLQVILVGDLFQLPPVNRDSTRIDFVHQCETWKSLDLQICYLTEQHRQDDGDGLLDLLRAMRRNELSLDHHQLLENRTGIGGDSLTRLFSHNADVDYINSEHLAKLPGDIKRYQMTTEGSQWKVEALMRNLLAPAVLELKVGAEVMFVANNFRVGFVNGTRGKVVKFKDGDPIVEVHESGRKIRVEPHKWQMKEDEHVVAEAEQLPLRLAWAITIHKSQGMSLDAAIVDLSKTFTPGQGYVALSRVRSLAGLYLLGMNEMSLRMNEQIYEFDAELMRLSEGLGENQELIDE